MIKKSERGKGRAHKSSNTKKHINIKLVEKMKVQFKKLFWIMLKYVSEKNPNVNILL